MEVQKLTERSFKVAEEGFAKKTPSWLRPFDGFVLPFF